MILRKKDKNIEDSTPLLYNQTNDNTILSTSTETNVPSHDLVDYSDADNSSCKFTKEELSYESPIFLYRYDSDTLTSNQDTEESLEVKSKKISSHKKKTIHKIILISSVLTIAILIFVLWPNLSDSKIYINGNAIEVIPDQKNNKTYIIDTEGSIIHTLTGMYYNINYLGNRSSAILSNDKESAYVNKDTNITIVENIRYANTNAEGKLIYISENNSQIRMLDPDTGTDIVLKENADLFYHYPVLSPDGRSYGYSIYRIEAYPRYSSSFISIDKKSLENFKDKIDLMAMSNDGKIIYYNYNVDNSISPKSILIQNAITKNHLLYGASKACFNSSNTELLYINDMGHTMLSRYGNPPVFLHGSSYLYPITPKSFPYNRNHSSTYLAIDSFLHKVLYLTDSSLIYIDSENNAISLGKADSSQLIFLTNDWNTLYYLDENEDIIKISDLKNKRIKEVIAEDCLDFIIANDGKEIYYTQRGQSSDSVPASTLIPNTNASGFDITLPDNHNMHYLYLRILAPIMNYAQGTRMDLYYKYGKKVSQRIASNVTDIAVNSKGDTLLYIQNDEGMNQVFSAKRGKVSRITGFESQYSYTLEQWNYGVALIEDIPDGTPELLLSVLSQRVYYTTDGLQYNMVLDNIQYVKPNFLN